MCQLSLNLVYFLSWQYLIPQASLSTFTTFQLHIYHLQSEYKYEEKLTGRKRGISAWLQISDIMPGMFFDFFYVIVKTQFLDMNSKTKDEFCYLHS